MKAGELAVGIGGLGAIGMAVVRALDDGIDGLRLAAVASRDMDKARQQIDGLASAPAVVEAPDLAQHADIIVECAPSAAFDAIATSAIEKGRIFVPSSVGALLTREPLISRARETGARIVVPTGALLGLDAVRAAAEGGITSVTMVTRKPPGGLEGAPHLVDNNIDVSNLSAPLKVFDGSARDGAKGFPTNVNITTTLSLANISPNQTILKI